MAEEIEEKAPEKAEEFEDITLSPGWVIITFLCLLNELIDWIGAILNVSGIWMIIILLINLATLFMVLGWRMLTEGFSFEALFGTWKTAVFLILEHVPVIGDIFPGWLLIMFGFRKKKIIKKAK